MLSDTFDRAEARRTVWDPARTNMDASLRPSTEVWAEKLRLALMLTRTGRVGDANLRPAACASLPAIHLSKERTPFEPLPWKQPTRCRPSG
jgi:hypothetical protein